MKTYRVYFIGGTYVDVVGDRACYSHHHEGNLTTLEIFVNDTPVAIFNAKNIAGDVVMTYENTLVSKGEINE